MPKNSTCRFRKRQVLLYILPQSVAFPVGDWQKATGKTGLVNFKLTDLEFFVDCKITVGLL